MFYFIISLKLLSGSTTPINLPCKAKIPFFQGETSSSSRVVFLDRRFEGEELTLRKKRSSHYAGFYIGST